MPSPFSTHEFRQISLPNPYSFSDKLFGKLMSHYRQKDHQLITKKALTFTFCLFTASLIKSFITILHLYQHKTDLKSVSDVTRKILHQNKYRAYIVTHSILCSQTVPILLLQNIHFNLSLAKINKQKQLLGYSSNFLFLQNGSNH